MPDPFSGLAFGALILPLAGFVVLALFGDAIKREEDQARAMGETGWLGTLKANGTWFAGLVACSMSLGAFLMSLLAVLRISGLIADESGLRFSGSVLPMEWIAVGGLDVRFSVLLDSLSAVMILVVSGVGSLIHIYSLGYMHDDEHRVRYFSYLNLFLFFMLLLVLGGNLPLMFVGWEGVGLCSYLLIGFWFHKPSAADAGKKAFIVNRIGDVGLILGMIVAFHALGTLDLVGVVDAAGAKPTEPLGSFGVLTTIALLLFLGACGKSAQLPLHVWLPDAMEGPTPVSALIHAATMVTAGVYMVVRLAPVFAHSETAMTVVAVVGTATALVAATVALVQTDIKRVLAYSTVSQLGYMFLACGVGAFGVGIFHLATHAFFKALLFLGSGSVIHAMGGEQDMRKMGGLWRRIPWTFWTFLVATLAISGIPFFAGFYSKDAILAAALEADRPLLFFVGWFTAVLTAFYMGRLLVLTFFGSFRGSEEAEHHLHESPWSMLGPLVILAIGSAFGGFVDIPGIVAPVTRVAFHEGPHPPWLPILATLGAAAGLAAAWYVYTKRTDLPGKAGIALAPLRTLLEHKYFFDDVYNGFARRVVVGGSDALLWRRVDAGLIDGIVNGVAGVVAGVARTARYLQTGLVRAYALLVLGGAVALLGYVLWLR